MSQKPRMETRPVGALKTHPDNVKLYGDPTPDESFVSSIKEKGVLNPVLISFDDRVISGHRRLAGARAAGLDEVPVVVFPSKDELDIIEALIHSNRQREKTREMIG